MKKSDHRRLYERLNHRRDIERLAKETGLDKELLLVIYTQKTVRMATKRFYMVKHKVKSLVNRWNNGTSLLRIADELHFPPVLTAYLILQEKSIPRKRFWEFVREPSTIKDSRLRREISEVVKHDIVYSPEGNEIQYERGRQGEKKLLEWLDRQNLKYQTESDLKGQHQKTPDVLLKTPIRTNSMNIRWIESKASFGDEVEVRKNSKRQLEPYTSLFGQGMVVYWFGYVEGVTFPKNVLIVDSSFFEKDLKNE